MPLNIVYGQVEKKNIYFKKRSRNSHMLAVSGPRNCTILAISGPRIRNQKSPEWCSFWGHKLPGNGYFWRHKLPKRLSFISGAINCQNGPVSGAINCQNGRQILYDVEDDSKDAVNAKDQQRTINSRKGSELIVTAFNQLYYLLKT